MLCQNNDIVLYDTQNESRIPENKQQFKHVVSGLLRNQASKFSQSYNSI